MDEDGQLVRVFIPDINAQKCLVVNPNDTVWTAKQVILDKINQELPNNTLNYSLYVPSTGSGKLGKFMDDGRMLAEYSLSGTVPRLEMRYKKRDYTIQVSLTEKAIQRANSKANQKKFVECITSGSTKKVEKLLEAGIDPNFITEDGNTPLGIACGRGGNVNCIMQILSNGGHIDFRGKDALTPMHRAAIGGNAQAVNVLMSFGAGVEYRDTKGLTPLYHTAIMGDNTGAALILLRNRAQIGIKDHGGWTELHQTSKYGHIEHAELFIRYGMDINVQNMVGNTPLHVACSHRQVDCAMLLLKRGADKSKLNFSNQSPSQVSILCGHHQLAADIAAFSADQVEPVKYPGDYNPSARMPPKQLYEPKPTSEMCPLSPPAELLVTTLTQEWEGTDTGGGGGGGGTPKLFQLKKETGRPGSGSSKSSNRVPDSESVCSLDQDSSTHSGSNAGTPGQTTPVYPRRQQPFQQQRERLYRAVQGQAYVAVADVEPQLPGDIPLHRGETVEVTFIGKGGYWEGRVGDSEGWFPRLAINEVGSEYESYGDDPQTPTSSTPKLGGRKLSTTSSSGSTQGSISEEPRKATSIKEVVITRSNRGFGFAMRGVRATKAMKFHPTPEVPALQYVGSVEAGGSADEAGLKTGDFIIEVNSHNVTYSTHDEVVDIVKRSGGVLRMKIITPHIKPKSHSDQMRIQMTPVVAASETGARQINGSIPEEVDAATTSGSRHQDPETVIGNESPALARITKSGWDSSQSQGEESPIGFSSSGFSYPHHVPASSPALPPPSTGSYAQQNYSPSMQAKVFPIPTSAATAGGRFTLQSHASQPHSLGRSSQLPSVAGVSKTMPIIPKPDYPKLSDYARDSDPPSDDDEHGTSEFELQLRKSRERMAERQSQIGAPRQRAMTNPDNTRSGSPLARNPSPQSPPLSPSHEDAMSPLAAQIMKANRDRKERMSQNQPRMTSTENAQQQQQQQSQAAMGSNLLASAMSDKINKVLSPGEAQDNRTSWDDSPHSSPHRIRLQSLPKRMPDVANPSKELPPTVKPKPSKKTPAFVVPDSPLLSGKPEAALSTIEEKNAAETGEDQPESPPWKVQLRSTPVNVRKSPDKAATEDSTLSLQVKKPKPSPAVAKKPRRQASLQQQPQPPSQGAALAPAPAGVAPTDYALPPPLPPSSDDLHSVSVSSHEVIPPPPAAFIITGAELGESSTDDIIPPPPLSPSASSVSSTGPLHSPSPAPPPPPQTSPPSQLPPRILSASSDGEVFVFPEIATEAEGRGAKDLASFDSADGGPDSSLTSPTLPSPLASPVVKRNTSFPSSPLPPPDFGSSVEKPSVSLAARSPSPSDILPVAAAQLEQSSPASDTSDVPPPLPSQPPPPLNLEGDEEEEENKDDQEPLIKDGRVNGGEEPIVRKDEVDEEGAWSQPPPRPPLPVMDDDDAAPVERKPSTSVSVALGNEFASEPQTAAVKALKEQPEKEEDEGSGYAGKAVREWGVEEVCAWLEDIGLGEHCQEFTDNEIIGEHLADMSKEDLKELGVKKLGHQKTFSAKIAAALNK